MNEKIVFTYAGFSSRSKDRLDYIIDAFLTLYQIGYTNILFNIIGADEKDFTCIFPKYKGKIEKIKKFVSFKGHLTHEETLELLSIADYSIFIRRNSRKNNAGFPTKFAESMSCGIPVVTNLTSNLSDYLVNGENGYIVSNRRNQLVFDLKKILDYHYKAYPYISNKCNDCGIFYYNKYINTIAEFNKKIGI